ncbi:hypothetical protein G9A89_008621 [Geosiphon pyriformis]|nr:hypothetical protein G9A89_008621 [Geosiphon pyriformis]
MGGAAIAIQKTKPISIPIVTNVYTYGMPRIGNQEFVLYAESMRVTYVDDYVPRNRVKFENPAENIEIHPGKEMWIKEKDNQKAYSCPFMLDESNIESSPKTQYEGLQLNNELNRSPFLSFKSMPNLLGEENSIYQASFSDGINDIIKNIYLNQPGEIDFADTSLMISDQGLLEQNYETLDSQENIESDLTIINTPVTNVKDQNSIFQESDNENNFILAEDSHQSDFPQRNPLTDRVLLKKYEKIVFKIPASHSFHSQYQHLTKLKYFYLLVHIFRTNNRIIASFKGNEGNLDLYVREDPGQSHYPGIHGSMVNKWFNNHFNNDIRKVFIELMRPFVAHIHDSYEVHTIGYGVGAAYAVLAALALQETMQIPRPEIPNVYTFGMPKIGNENFAKHAARLINIWRFTSKNDPTPRSPVSGVNYQYVHAGEEIWFRGKNGTEPSILRCRVPFDVGEHEGCISSAPGSDSRTHAGPYFDVKIGSCPHNNKVKVNVRSK